MNWQPLAIVSFLLLTGAAAPNTKPTAATTPAAPLPFSPLDRPLLILKYKAGADLAAFSPDGRILATEGSHSIRLTDLRTGEAVGATDTPPYAHAMTFSPDGKALLLASNVGTIEVLRLPTLVQDHVLRVAERYNVYALAVSADSTRAAAADGTGLIQLFDIASEKSLRTLGTSGPRNTALAFSPDGQRLAATFNDGHCIIFNTQTGEIIKDAVKVAADPAQIRFDSTGKTLGIAGSGAAIFFWNTLDKAAPDQLPVPDILMPKIRVNGPGDFRNSPDFRPMDAPLGDFAFGATALSSDLATAATALENGNIALWDVPTRKSLHILPNDQPAKVMGGGFTSLSFSPAGDLLATTNRNGLVQIWRIRGNAQPLTIAQPIDLTILPGPWGPPLDGLRTRLLLEPVKPDAPNSSEGPPIPGHPDALSQGLWWRVKLQIQNDSDVDRVFVWPELRVPTGLEISREETPVTFLPVPSFQPVKDPHPIPIPAHGMVTATSMLLGRMHDMAAAGKYRIVFPRTESPEPLPKNITNAILPASNMIEFTAEK